MDISLSLHGHFNFSISAESENSPTKPVAAEAQRGQRYAI